MGGEIGVVSKVGSGSTFWFSVPLPLSSAPCETFPMPAALCGQRLLILSSPIIGEVLRSYAESWKLRVDIATSPPKALLMLWRALKQGDPYKLIFADEDAIGEVPRFLQTIDRRAMLTGTQFVLVTSLFKKQSPTAPLRTRIEFLTKPIVKASLRGIILNTLGKQQGLVPSAALAQHPGQIPKQSALILVVEDNLVNQRVVSLELQKLGFEAHTVSNGLQAVKAVKERNYALVLMDIQMPEMDGLDATRIIRQCEAETGRHVPIIATTASLIRDEQQKCLHAGMDDCLAKPLRMETLQAALQKWIPALT